MIIREVEFVYTITTKAHAPVYLAPINLPTVPKKRFPFQGCNLIQREQSKIPQAKYTNTLSKNASPSYNSKRKKRQRYFITRITVQKEK